MPHILFPRIRRCRTATLDRTAPPQARTCKLNRCNEEQALPTGLVGKYVDERLLGLCSRGVELDRLVQLAASKAPEEHAGKAASTVQRKDEAWPHVQALDAVPLAALTPALLEDTIAAAARVAPRQAELALGTVKQALRDAMKRGQRVNPALLEVKAPRHEEREPVFLSAAEVEHLAL